jgi:adenylate kinase
MISTIRAMSRNVTGRSVMIPNIASTAATTSSIGVGVNNSGIINNDQQCRSYTSYKTSSSNNTYSNSYSHSHSYKSITKRTFKTRSFQTTSNDITNTQSMNKPGSRAFAECETNAIQDLFFQFAQDDEIGGVDEGGAYLCLRGVGELLNSIGEKPDELTLSRLFMEADQNGDGKLHLEEFLIAADKVLGGAPARIVIVVGGPGSGKGILCDRLAEECGVVHLSSGELLRDEVEMKTPLGNEVAEIMARGELVSSAVITALIRRRTRKFPGRRILLDGFPRSVENATDFLDLMGKPELALHLDCDDTILMERIMKRQQEGQENGTQRADDNFETAIQRLRTYHKYHHSTMDWLREQHVPIVNLDCSGSTTNVWNQLLAIGRLMRPATQLSNIAETPAIFDDIEPHNNTGT